MADKTLKIELDVEGKKAIATIDLADQQFKKLLQSVKSSNAKFAEWGQIVTGINQGFQLMKTGFNFISGLVEKAAEMEVLRSNFQGSKEDIELFNKAVAGTVTEGSLIKLSNQATDLGISMKEQAVLFSAAEDAADKYGGSTEDNFQKFVVASEGAAKGLKSVGIQKAVYEQILKELVKDLGGEIEMLQQEGGEREISIKNLDAETQKRLRLKAIIQATGVTMDDVIGKTADEKDKLEQLDVAFQKSQEEIGKALKEAFIPLSQILTQIFNTFNALPEQQKNMLVTVGVITTGIYGIKKAYDALNSTLLLMKARLASLGLIGAVLIAGGIVIEELVTHLKPLEERLNKIAGQGLVPYQPKTPQIQSTYNQPDTRFQWAGGPGQPAPSSKPITFPTISGVKPPPPPKEKKADSSEFGMTVTEFENEALRAQHLSDLKSANIELMQEGYQRQREEVNLAFSQEVNSILYAKAVRIDALEYIDALRKKKDAEIARINAAEAQEVKAAQIEAMVETTEEEILLKKQATIDFRFEELKKTTLYKENAEYRAAIDKQQANAKKKLDDDYWDDMLKQSTKYTKATESGFQAMWNEFIVGSRQAKNAWDAVWLAIRNSFLQDVGAEAWGLIKKGLFSKKKGDTTTGKTGGDFDWLSWGLNFLQMLLPGAPAHQGGIGGLSGSVSADRSSKIEIEMTPVVFRQSGTEMEATIELAKYQRAKRQ